MTGPSTPEDGTDAVLCWAAGGDEVPAADLEPDEDVLLDLVDRHALSGRLLRRLASTPGPPWAGPGLRDGLTTLYDGSRGLLEAHAHAAAEIVGLLGAAPEPVLVKGISTFLTTGADHTVRCGDIDLVCADGDRLIEVLTGLGYHRTRPAFLHEIGEFTRDATEIDVHAYFPVYSYTGLDSDDLEPARHDGVWRQRGHRMALRRIGWADMDRGRLRTPVGHGHVSVPDPCLSAIVLSAHAFMNFTNVWSISHREKPYVRLGELADLADLARHPDFDAERFLQLVDRFDAGDAVRWAGWASTVLTGSSPLPEIEPGSGTGFPRCLWWSFWTDLQVAPATLVRPGWLDMAELVTALGASTVVLDGSGTGRIAVADEQRLPRRLHLDGVAPDPPWSVAIDAADGPTVTIGLPERPAAAVERVRVDLGTTAAEWSLDAATGRQTVTGAEVACTLDEDEHGRALTLRFAGAATERLDLLVGIAEEDRSGAHTASVLLPLTVRSGLGSR